ncbi:hypothetical protein OOT46_12600 [Aquabacterium sp. A7-Y]|uniref:hypothetical protein n=1 Tax=Aquabacterium sp. A7-Y TaxID=1349605 RepID=UPI00223E2C7A|nr:hypothetical protein [Aquabacterium sp. A7-Y]MCW7538683.1 hypothetical protein [Aquabacterium sp. A7-Y]
MIPLPDVIEYLDDLPTEFDIAAIAAPPQQAMAASAHSRIDAVESGLQQAAPSADLLTLARFRELMAGYGWPVQIARMLIDRAYAFDRMALAHSSGDETLSALALEIFESCQRAPAPTRSAAQAH